MGNCLSENSKDATKKYRVASLTASKTHAHMLRLGLGTVGARSGIWLAGVLLSDPQSIVSRTMKLVQVV